MFETTSSFFREEKLITVISKTNESGRKLKNEGYLCTDAIFTKSTKNTFTIKAKCSASMKKDQKRCCGNTSTKNIQSRKG